MTPITPTPQVTSAPIPVSVAPVVASVAPPPVPLVQPPPPPAPVVPVAVAPKKSLLVWIIAGVGLLVFVGLVVGGKMIADQMRRENPLKEVDVSKGGKTNLLAPNIKEDLSKYDVDTDGDGFPDFLETSLGLNPNASEYDTCKAQNACSGAQLTDSSSKKNVMIILDASGSMGLANGGQTRMDAAKAAIKGYVTSVASDPSISLGLMVYGHKGSNSTADKPISCAAAEVVAAIGSVNSSTIDGFLTSIKATGWTPMGLAITNAQAAFAGKDGEKNQIVLVTDGDETCNSNPAGAAGTIHNSSANVTVNVIGFAVSSAEQTTLNAIATAGGGSFSVAATSEELVRKMNENLDNLKKINTQINCSLDAHQKFLDCYRAASDKVYNYLTDYQKKYWKKEIVKEEYDKVTKLTNDIWDKKLKVSQEKAEGVQDLLDKNNKVGR